MVLCFPQFPQPICNIQILHLQHFLHGRIPLCLPRPHSMSVEKIAACQKIQMEVRYCSGCAKSTPTRALPLLVSAGSERSPQEREPHCTPVQAFSPDFLQLGPAKGCRRRTPGFLAGKPSLLAGAATDVQGNLYSRGSQAAWPAGHIFDIALNESPLQMHVLWIISCFSMFRNFLLSNCGSPAGAHAPLCLILVVALVGEDLS